MSATKPRSSRRMRKHDVITWFSAFRRLPKPQKEVLIVCWNFANPVTTGCWLNGWQSMTGGSLTNVTHWANLPAYPRSSQRKEAHNTVPVIWTPSTKLPDSDLTVLIHSPKADEPVWLGYHDGEFWRDVSGGMISDDVTHWAEMPEGPSRPSIP